MKRKELKMERIKQDLTQSQVAEKIGISTQRYSLFENGNCNLNFVHLKALISFLKIKFEIL